MFIRRITISAAGINALIAVAVIALTGILLAAAPSAYAYDNEELAFLTLINNYRASSGLPPLIMSSSLYTASEGHSSDMIINDFFSHTGSNGSTPWDRIRAAGYTYNTYLGENIAAGYSSAQSVFDAWRNSPGHNANMLSSNFHAIGVGRVYGTGSTYGWYWTTDFGGVAVDNTPPNITNIQPSGTISTAATTVSAGYSDDYSGINTASVVVGVDGAALSGCSVTANSVSCPKAGLGVGSHSIAVYVNDNTGNAGFSLGSFQVVDALAPVISSLAPTGSITINSPALSADYADGSPSSGINTAAVSVSLDGSVLAGCAVSATKVSCQPGNLADGSHQVSLSVSDNAGNTGTQSWSFTVLGGPIVVGQSPAPGALVDNPTTPVSASWVKKGLVDINPASVQVYIDGALVSAPAVTLTSGPDSGSFSFQPDWSARFADGEHSARLVVADIKNQVTGQTWSFTVVSPNPSLSMVRVYWDSYAAYASRMLAVDYRLANIGSGAGKASRVELGSASGGVMLVDTLPYAIGDIAVAGSANFSLRYQVPAGVTSFRAVSYVSCSDDGGNTYWFPGAPSS